MISDRASRCPYEIRLTNCGVKRVLRLINKRQVSFMLKTIVKCNRSLVKSPLISYLIFLFFLICVIPEICERPFFFVCVVLDNCMNSNGLSVYSVGVAACSTRQSFFVRILQGYQEPKLKCPLPPLFHFTTSKLHNFTTLSPSLLNSKHLCEAFFN